MWKYFTAVDTIQWRPILQDLVTKKENKSKVFWNLYGEKSLIFMVVKQKIPKNIVKV